MSKIIEMQITYGGYTFECDLDESSLNFDHIIRVFTYGCLKDVIRYDNSEKNEIKFDDIMKTIKLYIKNIKKKHNKEEKEGLPLLNHDENNDKILKKSPFYSLWSLDKL